VRSTLSSAESKLAAPSHVTPRCTSIWVLAEGALWGGWVVLVDQSFRDLDEGFVSIL
jgi:hypothetical protein